MPGEDEGEAIDGSAYIRDVFKHIKVMASCCDLDDVALSGKAVVSSSDT